MQRLIVVLTPVACCALMSCVGPLDLHDKPCPCAPGSVCCESTQTCKSAQDVCPAVNPTPAQSTLDGLTCGGDAHQDVPARIVLVIDTSESMLVNDPANARAGAAEALISRLSERESVSFALVDFNTGATADTTGFSRDPATLQNAIDAFGEDKGFTNYLDALTVTAALIEADITQVTVALRTMEESGQDWRASRPWYVVIFMSDGIPRLPAAALQAETDILSLVGRLTQIPEAAAGIILHTVYFGPVDALERPDAEQLLRHMASRGGGSFTSFTSAEQLDFTTLGADGC